jgi:hypothetical protein
MIRFMPLLPSSADLPVQWMTVLSECKGKEKIPTSLVGIEPK